MTNGTRHYYWDPDFTKAYPAQALAYVDAALLVCSICEALGSLDLEIKYIWKGPRNASQIFYLLSRYICIFSFAIFLASDDPILNALNRGYFFGVQGFTHWLFNINLIFVELIFLRRTWALWDCSRKVAIWLSVLSAFTWVTTFALIILGMVTLNGDFTYLYFIPLMFFYLVILVLVVARMVTMRKNLNTSLVRLVYAQGVAWYAILFVLSMTGLINVLLDPLRISAVSRVVQFVFVHMACRMTLSLRDHRDHAVVGDINFGHYFLPAYQEQMPPTLSDDDSFTRVASEPEVKLEPLRRPLLV